MRDFTGKRYWLVGASEGLGKALAEKLSRMGAHVILSARNAEKLQAVADGLPGQSTVAPMDISDSTSVQAAADQIGQVDGMVFLAGVYWPIGARDWDVEQVEMMLDVNFIGAARVLGRVVPQMVDRDSGHIVITGSLSAFRGMPGAIGYAPSKAGCATLAESLECDLRNTGVDVQLINPGYIRTRLTEKNDFTMPQIMDAEDAAAIMVEHMMGDKFARSFPAPFAWLFRLSNFMPEWLFFKLFAVK